jgi:hypothetical protein
MKRTRLGLLFVMGMLALILTSPGPATRALAQDTQHVGLVVKFDDGSVFTDCIDYTGSGMTGEDVLDASGLPVVKEIHAGLGAAICKIENDGCDHPPDNCFCQCPDDEGKCKYWAYFHLDEQKGEWTYSGMGASGHTVQAGDVEGWAWGAGTPEQPQAEPPLITFEELCVPPTPTPTPSPPVVEFTADPGHILAGQCSTLRWSVDNGEAVILDGEGVRPDDARYLCPSESQTYELQVLNAAGEYYYEVTIQVTQPTATPLPTATPTTVRPTATSVISAPPPTSTLPAPQSALSPSPSPTQSPTATNILEPTIVAMAPTATTSIVEEQSPGGMETPDARSPETTNSPTTPETTPQEAVGLDRILLLLGVGAGTLGFGTLVFVGMVALLILIYFRARAQF